MFLGKADRYILGSILNDRVMYTLAYFQGYFQAFLAATVPKLKIDFKEKNLTWKGWGSVWSPMWFSQNCIF